MKRIFWIALVTMALIITNSMQVNADRGGGHRGHGGHGGHGGNFGVGVVIEPGWGPGWWGWPYYPYYPYYPAQPTVVQKDPEVYVQPEEPGYWYFCPDPQGYYPYVKQCPKGWMKVVPSPPPGEEAN